MVISTKSTNNARYINDISCFLIVFQAVVVKLWGKKCKHNKKAMSIPRKNDMQLCHVKFASVI